MRLIWTAPAALLPAFLIASPALAQERSKILTDVVDCRKITDSTERLACYDKAVGAMDVAEKDRQIVVVDKEQVQEARRSVFGLSLPRIRLFGGGDDTEVNEVETTVKTIDRNGAGRVFFTVEDGARWVQTDDRTVVNVRPGTIVTLKRGAMGSFFAKFRGGIAVRVARVN